MKRDEVCIYLNRQYGTVSEFGERVDGALAQRNNIVSKCKADPGKVKKRVSLPVNKSITAKVRLQRDGKVIVQDIMYYPGSKPGGSQRRLLFRTRHGKCQVTEASLLFTFKFPLSRALFETVNDLESEVYDTMDWLDKEGVKDVIEQERRFLVCK